MKFLQLLAGLILGPSIGYAAWRAHALSASGAIAAGLVGAVIFSSGGLLWAAGLLVFFLSSSLLSRLFKTRKKSAAEKFSKGDRRDWGQVAANGGLGAVLALAHLFLPDADWVFPAFLGAMAAVNADTWATELGVLNPAPPRLITTGRKVETGTSGAVSLPGTAASLGGALLVGLLALVPGQDGLPLLIIVGIAGLAGSLFDSLLGATVQAIYYCPQHEKETEQHPTHICGVETIHIRGWRRLNNDLVNFAASFVGAGTAAWLVSLI